MIKQKLLLLAIMASLTSGVSAQEVMVQTLSEGACWFEQGEQLKVVSFNDQEVFMVGREELEEGLTALFSDKKSKTKKGSLELNLHCGGYGASLVVKGPDFCAWMKFDKGQLEVRSHGGLESVKGSTCDGYKKGELIVGVINEMESPWLQTPVSPYIKSADKISKNLYRINLKNEYHGKEIELLKELKNLDNNIRYVELNQFQHPVGEYTQLK